MSLHLMIGFLVVTVYSYNIDVDNAIVYTKAYESRLNYFGMTVAIRPRAEQFINSSWVVQIGAPRSNQTGITVREPGALYRCHLCGPCELSPLNARNNQFVQVKTAWGRKTLASNRKDNGWVGVAMDIKDTSKGLISVVCGHRMSYQASSSLWNIIGNPYLMTGGCYVETLSSSYSLRTLYPINNEERAYQQTSATKAIFDWGQGLSGMAATLTDNGLLLGAPHLWFMTGTALIYPMDFTQPRVADITPVADIKRDYYAYNGYSVASGKFFGDRRLWFVFGAPRSGGLHGRVFVFSFKNKNNRETIEIHTARKGETYGEYFGSSLDVGDLNGDEYDDLIVGAPMFSRRYPDQGRVYVFLGGKTNFETPQQGAVLTGANELGRFGTCVKLVGDLDQDGYFDAVIGAPGEAGQGAVYIYRGGPRGLSPHPGQIILAKDILPELRGFGISVSRAVDVDRNHYPDVIIGAYMSDQAVLLRTRPVVELVPVIQSPLFLDRKQTEFSINFCLPYTANYPPASCNVDMTVVLDEEYNRVWFKTMSHVWHMENVETHYSNPYCQNLTIRIDRKRLNGTFTKPIKVAINATLHPAAKEKSTYSVWNEAATLHPVLPIIRLESSKGKVTADVPFAGDCGVDNVCQSQLEMTCNLLDLSSDTFVVGSKETLTLLVAVGNIGEPAHHTVLSLKADGISIADISLRDPGCSLSKDTINCNMSTIDHGSEKKLTFQLVTDLWTHSVSQRLMFFLAANSAGNEAHCQVGLNLVSDAQVHLISSPTQTISLTKNTPQSFNFSHIYEVRKNGMSPVKETNLKISIPTTFRNDHEFAVFDKNNVESSEVSVPGEVSEVDFDSELSVRVLLEEEESSPPLRFSPKRSLFLNCSAEDVHCITIEVYVSEPSFVFDVPILFSLSAIEFLLKDIDVIYFSTNATATSQLLFGYNIKSYKSASTYIIKAPAPAAVETRVIVLSAIAGGLILALTIPILVREGFFRRKTREQMKALKTQDFIQERFSMYGPVDTPDISVQSDEEPSTSFN